MNHFQAHNNLHLSVNNGKRQICELAVSPENLKNIATG